jgi:oxygen-independent coproporphyrinogen-3 oxidase
VSADLPGEFMMNALRLKHGVLDSVFETRTGQSVEVIAAQRAALVNLGLMDADVTRLRATDLGYRHLDSLIERFI